MRGPKEAPDLDRAGTKSLSPGGVNPPPGFFLSRKRLSDPGADLGGLVQAPL